MNESSPLLTSPSIQVAKEDKVGGEKTIGFLGSVVLTVNNITGPGLVTIPLLYQQAGWITCTIFMIFCMVMSALSSLMLCQAMSRIPGNDRFQSRIEFTTLAKHYFPKWGFYITLTLFIVSLLSQIISAIVVSAQTMDLALLAIFKKSFAIEFYPHPGFVTITQEVDSFSPFGAAYVLSLGYVIVIVMTLPLGIFNLDDNIIVQKGAVIALFTIFIEWFVCYFVSGISLDRVPTITPAQGEVVGSILFNFAFVVTIPSWVNEKKEDVSIPKTIWTAVTISTMFYILTGLFGGWAFNYLNGMDLLDAINLYTTGPLHIVSQICVYVFPVVALMSSIPIFSIIARYNLVENHICRKIFANWWAVVFPWIIAVAFYAGAGLLVVINVASLLVQGFINFVIPMAIYIVAMRTKDIPPPPSEEKHPSFRNYGKRYSASFDKAIVASTINNSDSSSDIHSLDSHIGQPSQPKKEISHEEEPKDIKGSIKHFIQNVIVAPVVDTPVIQERGEFHAFPKHPPKWFRPILCAYVLIVIVTAMCLGTIVQNLVELATTGSMN